MAEEKETVILPPTTSKWKLSGKKADGDIALALFGDPNELREPIDPAEEARLVRRIDIRILILIGVCYAFFYIDKTTLSYVHAQFYGYWRRLLTGLTDMLLFSGSEKISKLSVLNIHGSVHSSISDSSPGHSPQTF